MLLRRKQLLEIHQSAISLNLGTQRTALLAGLPGLLSSLTVTDQPAAQLLTDLTSLNDRPPCINGEEAPLETWLQNAMALCPGDPRAQVFQNALHQLQNGQLTKTQPSACSRETYLKALIKQTERRLILQGLSISGDAVQLSKVWLPVRLFKTPEGEESGRILEDFLDSSLIDNGRRFIFLGEAGAGKSEALMFSAQWLANKALSDPEAPIPLHVRARDLEAGLQKNLEREWPDIGPHLSTLLNASKTTFIVLVDALDEAGPKASDYVEKALDALDGRVRALLLTSRPVLRWNALQSQEFWLRRWTDATSLDYLNRWRHVDSNAVDAIQNSPHRDELNELLGTPLTATLCVYIANRTPTALSSRAALYGTVIEKLVDDWLESKEIDLDLSRKKLFDSLQSLALGFVQEGGAALPEAELNRILRTYIPEQVSTARNSMEAQLGMLIERPDGGYDFAFRGIAEHLAGRALLAQGKEAVISAARKIWAQEVVRHAIGWDVELHSEQQNGWIEALLEGEEEDDITTSNKHLRPLLVALQVAADCGELLPEVTQKLLGAALRRMLDETSLWVGERVADVLPVWLRANRLAARYFLGELQEVTVTKGQTPAQWYDAQHFEESGQWFHLLFRRDPDVRSVAAQKLVQWVDDPEVRNVLWWLLEDEGTSGASPSVAMAAGFSLRKAKREERFEERRELLLYWLEHGWQMTRAGAALALLPSEASNEALILGLKEGLMGSGQVVPREVVEAIAASEAGRIALEQHIPNWKEMPEQWVRPWAPLGKKAIPAPPFSDEVRRRFLKAATPILDIAGEVFLQKLHASDARGLFMAACDLALTKPKLAIWVLDHLDPRWPPWVEDMPSLSLGRAAAEHPDLRNALMRFWTRAEEQSRTAPYSGLGNFPGRAFELLIPQGDTEAISSYGKWLQITSRSILFQAFRFALCEGIDIPASLKESMKPYVDDLWAYATERCVDAEGKRTFRHIGPTSACLWRLSAFWQDDSEMRARLEQWLEDEDPNHVMGALLALEHVGLSEEARQNLIQRAPQLISAERLQEPFGDFECISLLQQFERAGIAKDIKPLLFEILRWNNGLSIIAGAMLLPYLSPEEMSQISSYLASNIRLLLPIEPLLPTLAKRLVEAAPEAWTDAIAKEETIGPLFKYEGWMPMLKHLPLASRQSIIEKWAINAEEIPWRQLRDNPGICTRPADRVRELLFDLGLEEPSASEDLAPDPRPS